MGTCRQKRGVVLQNPQGSQAPGSIPSGPVGPGFPAPPSRARGSRCAPGRGKSTAPRAEQPGNPAGIPPGVRPCRTGGDYSDAFAAYLLAHAGNTGCVVSQVPGGTDPDRARGPSDDEPAGPHRRATPTRKATGGEMRLAAGHHGPPASEARGQRGHQRPCRSGGGNRKPRARGKSGREDQHRSSGTSHQGRCHTAHHPS